MIGIAFGPSITLDAVGLVSCCHGRDGLWLRGSWRQELDRVIARASRHQVERPGCHFCVRKSPM